jgi:hypothetical protein
MTLVQDRPVGLPIDLPAASSRRAKNAWWDDVGRDVCAGTDVYQGDAP